MVVVGLQKIPAALLGIHLQGVQGFIQAPGYDDALVVLYPADNVVAGRKQRSSAELVNDLFVTVVAIQDVSGQPSGKVQVFVLHNPVEKTHKTAFQHESLV